MRSREEVLREFGTDELARLLPPVVAEQIRAMADRIRELEAQQTAGEPVAWYVERVAPGVRDHGIRYGPTFSETEADRWTDEIHMKRPLYAHPRPREQTAGEPVAWDSLLRELRQCAATWEPQVVLLGSGNLTSARIVALCDHFLTHPRPRVGVTEAMVEALRTAVELLEDAALSDEGLDGQDAADGAKKCRAALALVDADAPGVVELAEWRVVDCNGVEQEVNGTAFSADEGREFAVWHDKRFPQVAPHRVMRVCLKPLANGGGEVTEANFGNPTGTAGVGYLDSVLVAIVCDVRGGMSTTAILDKYRAALAASTRTGEGVWDDARDAARWRLVRKFLVVDGDFISEHGEKHVQWVQCDDKLMDTACAEGWGHTVESLIDAALAASTRTGEQSDA